MHHPRRMYAVVALMVGVALHVVCPSATAAGSIAGLVTADGTPLSGVTIEFSGGVPPVLTGEAGTYSVAVPGEGAEVTITPRKSGIRFAPASLRAWVSPGESVRADFAGTGTAAPAPAAALPDLRGVRCWTAASALWGAVIPVDAMVKNQGAGAAPSFRVAWYLSKDAQGSADDIPLSLSSGAAFYTHTGLAARSTGRSFRVSLRLPGSLPSGWTGTTFYLVMKSDSGSQVAESIEGNNFGQAGEGSDRARIVVGLLPDLQGARCEISRYIGSKWGDAVAFSCAVRNAGQGPAGPFRVQWYLSKDETGSSDDVLLPLDGGASFYSHPGIAADTQGDNILVTLRLPSPPQGWTGTNFVVIMKTDAANQVAESNEGNNFGRMGGFLDVAGISIASLPDLFGYDLLVPDSTQWGRSIAVTAMVRNSTGIVAPASQVAFYLVSHGGDGPILLHVAGGTASAFACPAVSGDTYRNVSATLSLPAALPTGWQGPWFSVVAKVDSAGQVTEEDEDNNEMRRSLSIGAKPDLYGYECSAPAGTSTWGQTVTVTGAIRNGAEADSGAFRVQWYLSRDNQPSSDDRLLPRTASAGSWYAHPAIRSWSTAPTFTVTLQLPGTPPTGWRGSSFCILMKTDAANQVAETNEGNNFGTMGRGWDYCSVQILGLPDLSGAWFSGPSSSVGWGDILYIAARASNTGGATTSTFRVQWYLSKDPTGSADDVLLRDAETGSTFRSHPLLGAATWGNVLNAALQLPAAKPSGWTGTRFYVIMKTDTANQVAESNEGNNFGQMGDYNDRCVVYIGALPDLLGQSCYASERARWGEAITVRGQVQNAGHGVLDKPFRVQWYLSKDPVGSGDDLLLPLADGGGDGFTHPSQTGSWFTLRLQLPDSAPAGWTGSGFYLVMKTDSGNAIKEEHEANNFGQAGENLDYAAITVTEP